MSRTIRRLRLAPLLAALAASASPALAEPETGSLIDRNRDSVGSVRSEASDAARQVMNAFGRCVARNRSERVTAILDMPLYSQDQGKALQSLMDREGACLGDDVSSFRSDALGIVGAMAEWFVLNRYAGVGLGRIVQIAPPEPGEATTVHELIATCIARSQPAAAFALIRTRPASDDEQTALARLVPHFAPCLPKGQNRFSRSSLRAIVAAGLYRVLSAASGPGGAPSSEPD
jgi:hypothetical protein